MKTRGNVILIVVGSLLSLLVLATFGLSRFNYRSVCDRCGRLQRTREWQIRSIRFPVFRTASDVETPVSRALSKIGFVGPHEHHWRFVLGSGDEVRCAAGFVEAQPTVESVDLAQLLEDSDRYGESRFKASFWPISSSQGKWSRFGVCSCLSGNSRTQRRSTP